MKNGNSNELLQIINFLIKKAEILLIWLDSELKIKFINQATKNIYGWENKEVIGKSYLDECKASFIQSIDLALFEEVLKGESFVGCTNKIGNNKNYTTVQWDLFPIQDNSKITNLVMIGFDLVRDIKKGSYLYNIINNIPHYIFWKNRNSMFLGCNQVFSKVAQLDSPEDIVGKTDYDLPWKKSESDAYRKDDEDVLVNDKPKLNIEETQTLENGELLTLLTSKVPLHNADSEVIGVLGIYSDITEIKRNQEALQQAKYQLKGAKLISGAIAHEIRTPLATIKSNIQGMMHVVSKLIEIYELASKDRIKTLNIKPADILNLKKAISLIDKKVDQSNIIINMLLTKLQSVDFEFSDFEICTAIDCVKNALEDFMVPEDMIEKIKLVEENDFEFKGNRTLIVHIIMNLLKNAIFYIQKAHKGTISIWMEKHPNMNEIHFKDTGWGISQDILPHIFDSFFTTETSIGTGIGLAFSKMVMNSHGGDITCISGEREYTKFTLSFPKYKI